jgi:small subunit ribosomal protein S13
MLYIFGTYLKKKKYVRIALSYIYGIGNNNSCKICNSIGIGNKIRMGKITNTQIYNIRKIIKKKYKITGDLRKYILLNIKRYIEIKSYRGLRHKLSYPVRGQRTHTNAATQKKLSKQRYNKVNFNYDKQKINQVKNKTNKKKK